MSETTEDSEYAWLLHRPKNAYEILKLDFKSASNITSREIRQAYRKQALIFHPDKNKSDNAEEEFREIAVSYSVLLNPELKDRYDEYLRNIEIKLQNEANLTEKQIQLKNDLINEEKEFINQLQKIKLRRRKVEMLREQNLKLRKQKQKEMYQSNIGGGINNISKNQNLLSSSIHKLPKVVRVKWKNKSGIERLDSDVIRELMEVFGDIKSIRMSSSNTPKSSYHYASIEYTSLKSCALALLHDYSKTASLWDNKGLRKLSSLLRSCKFANPDDFKIVDQTYKKSELTFDEYIGITLLKLCNSLSN